MVLQKQDIRTAQRVLKNGSLARILFPGQRQRAVISLTFQTKLPSVTELLFTCHLSWICQTRHTFSKMVSMEIKGRSGAYANAPLIPSFLSICQDMAFLSDHPGRSKKVDLLPRSRRGPKRLTNSPSDGKFQTVNYLFVSTYWLNVKTNL